MKKKIFIFSGIIITIGVLAGVFLQNTYTVPVLMYHSIDHRDKETKLSVSPESFARQMEFLHKNHYNVVTLDKIVSYIEKKERIPPRTLAITFDDGFYNNYEYAFPMLKKYNIPATVFVIVGSIGKPGWVKWSELKEMSDSGVITIGSHTLSHGWLPTTGTKKLRSELEASKEILEKNLGRNVDFFCYPIGAFDDRVKKAVKEADYACAVTTNPDKVRSTDDRYAIKRIKISRSSDNLFVFWVKTSGWYK
jgi:peptidoglycan/xylan/chitin deacetylase (PgdA/CDA1 family)